MSGGPPHHPHNRQVPATNTAWNHLQVPNYFPRQPQLAHMSNEHSLLTWHTPTTTEAVKIHPHTHMFNEMLKNNTEPIFPKDCVDLSLARNGNQNGELSAATTTNVTPSTLTPIISTVAPISSVTPISLSVRDANKINSLPASALEIQAVELTKCSSPGLKASPGLKMAAGSPGSGGFKSGTSVVKASSPGLKPTSPSVKVGSPVSPGLKCDSPSLKSDSLVLKATSPSRSLSSQMLLLETSKSQQKRSNIRVDSILERLNPMTQQTDKVNVSQENNNKSNTEETGVTMTAVETTASAAGVTTSKALIIENTHQQAPVADKPVQSVIVQPSAAASSNFDENSNSNSISNLPVCTNIRDEDTVSTNSNEDSLDSVKSRRKRKPCKTVRVSKEEEKLDQTDINKEAAMPVTFISAAARKEEVKTEKDPISIVGKMLEECAKTEAESSRRSSDDLEDIIPAKTRRKASSESETIDNIAAMVQEGLKEKELTKKDVTDATTGTTKPISVSVIKSKENIEVQLTVTSTTTSTSTITTLTPAQKKSTNTHFVEVENKLEEMFAGIEDSSDPLKSDNLNLDDSKLEDPLSKLDESLTNSSATAAVAVTSATSPGSQENVTSTTEVKKKPPSSKKSKKKLSTSATSQNEASPPKKKKPMNKKASGAVENKLKTKLKRHASSSSSNSSISQRTSGVSSATVTNVAKLDAINKDVYAYDSGSNASSSKSKGPYIQIRGPRDSPLSVSIVNAPLNDEEDKKLTKCKKFHDDIEYRHKVRSKGLHSSTLSNKYDAQTKDATWICAFCKRGPHANSLSGPTSDGLLPAIGDLFGPYFITKDCLEFERRLDDPFDKQFKSRKISRVLQETTVTPKGKKSKKKHSHPNSETAVGAAYLTGDIYLGITQTDSKTFEVWAHEDCIVWSAGIYLIGPKIVGLEEAIWTSCNVECKSCHLKGANICCGRRGCLTTIHLCCARREGWQFVESAFKAYCLQHKLL